MFTTTYNGDGEDDNVTETKTFTYDSIGNMLTYGSDNYVMEWNGKQLANFTEHDRSNGHSYTSTDYFYMNLLSKASAQMQTFNAFEPAFLYAHVLLYHTPKTNQLRICRLKSTNSPNFFKKLL